jgi:hypothetical protein
VTRPKEESWPSFSFPAKNLATAIEAAETKSDGKAGRATGDALGIVSFQALFARDYPKALTAADRALTIAPNELWIVMNRAHALMFVGRINDASTLYLAHKDERIANNANKLWQQVVAEDFAELRKAGVTNRLMPKIENALGVGAR